MWHGIGPGNRDGPVAASPRTLYHSLLSGSDAASSHRTDAHVRRRFEIRLKVTGRQVAFAAIIVAEIALLVGIVVWARGRSTPGIVVAPGSAAITVAPQRFVSDRVVIEKVKTPVDGWVVLSVDTPGMPHKVIGATKVSAGQSTDVEVALTASPGAERVSATLYTGRGGSGAAMAGSYGQPLVMRSKPVTVSFTVTPLSRTLAEGTAEVATATLVPADSSVVLASVLAPAPSWLVVARPGVTTDQPGPVLGYVLVPAGRSVNVTVPIAVPPTPSAATTGSAAPTATTPTPSSIASGYPAGWADLTLFLFADQGDPLNRVFEFDASSPRTSADQPYLIGGLPVAVPVNDAALFVQRPVRRK